MDGLRGVHTKYLTCLPKKGTLLVCVHVFVLSSENLFASSYPPSNKEPKQGKEPQEEVTTPQTPHHTNYTSPPLTTKHITHHKANHSPLKCTTLSKVHLNATSKTWQCQTKGTMYTCTHSLVPLSPSPCPEAPAADSLQTLFQLPPPAALLLPQGALQHTQSPWHWHQGRHAPRPACHCTRETVSTALELSLWLQAFHKLPLRCPSEARIGCKLIISFQSDAPLKHI